MTISSLAIPDVYKNDNHETSIARSLYGRAIYSNYSATWLYNASMDLTDINRLQ
jgi:hypothetical protein